MQLKEKKSSMERDKRKLESELEKQRQKIGKQVFLQVVQKKTQNETINQQQPQSPQTNLTVMTATPQQLILSNLNNSSSSSSSPTINNTLFKETPRRQWDKTQGFIDLENETSINKNGLDRKPLNSNGTGAGASSTSSMSTPSSSASQSPPLSNVRNNNNNNNNNNIDINMNENENDSSSTSSNSSTSSKMNNEQKSVDLISKAYYSRDEMMKTIETLKSSANVFNNSSSKMIQSPAPAPVSSNSNSSSNSAKDIESELQKANSKLSELQNEITRLNLLQQHQQNQQSQKYSNKSLMNGANNNLHSIIADNSKIDQQELEDQIEGGMFQIFLTFSNFIFNFIFL